MIFRPLGPVRLNLLEAGRATLWLLWMIKSPFSFCKLSDLSACVIDYAASFDVVGFCIISIS